MTQSSPQSDRNPQGPTFIVDCRVCEARQIVPESHIESKHRSAEGLVGYVRCAVGHLTVHKFAEAYPKPKPPASVIALRAQLAAAHTVSERHVESGWPVTGS